MYATVDNMVTILSQIASRTSITSEQMAYFATAADREINARIAKFYTVPVSSCPLLETIATEIALQKMLQQRVFTMERRNDSDWPEKAFAHAWDTLKEIASGEITIVDSSGAVIAQSTNQVETWSNTMNYNPTFTEDNPLNSYIDDDKIDDIRDARD